MVSSRLVISLALTVHFILCRRSQPSRHLILEADSEAAVQEPASERLSSVLSAKQETQLDFTLQMLVYWKIKRMSNFLAAIPGIIYRAKQQKGLAHHRFTINGDEAACQVAFTEADSLLAYLENLDEPIKWPIGSASVSKIEAHGSRVDLDKLRAPLADYPMEYWQYVVDPSKPWATEWAPFYFPAQYASSQVYAPDTTLNMMVYWKVNDMGGFIQGFANFAEKVKRESDTKYYSFTVSGDRAMIRGGYTGAEGFLAHFKNVDRLIQAAMKVAAVIKIEAHGPKLEVNKLADPLKTFNTTYWGYVDNVESAFFVPSTYESVKAKAPTVPAVIYMTDKVSTCDRDTGGTCSVLPCDDERGPTDCVSQALHKKCLCKDGFCNRNGRCVSEAAPHKGEHVVATATFTAMTNRETSRDVPAGTKGKVLDLDEDDDAKIDFEGVGTLLVFSDNFHNLELDIAFKYELALKALRTYTSKITIRDGRYVPSWEGGSIGDKGLPYRKSPKVFNSAPKRPQHFLEAMAAELKKHMNEDQPWISGKMDLSLYHELAIFKGPSYPKKGVPAESLADLAGSVDTTKSETFVLDEPTIVGDIIVLTLYVQMALKLHFFPLMYLKAVEEFSFRVKDGLVVDTIVNCVDYASGPQGQRKTVNMMSLLRKARHTLRQPDPHTSCLKITKNKTSCV